MVMNIIDKITDFLEINYDYNDNDTYEDTLRKVRKRHNRERRDWQRDFRNKQKVKEENERISYKIKKLENKMK